MIKKITQDKPVAACFAIGRKLPDFFNDEGFRMMERDLAVHDIYAIEQNNEMIGFITIHMKNPRVAEISWLAVDPRYHNRGYGTQLLEYVAGELKKSGITILEVKTLDQKADYEPYERTRNYYIKNGFIHLETIDPYPEWGEDNPCAIYVKIL